MTHNLTLMDVARSAGVSRSTAGFVLSNRHDIAIPEATRLRVKQVAAEMNYRPNQAARALSSGRTKTITIAFPGAIHSYHAGVLETFERHTTGHGYNLIASTIGHSDPHAATSDLLSLVHGPTDAVVLVDMFERYRRHIDPAVLNAKPIVAIGINNLEALDCVEVDLKPASYEACRHLLERAPPNIIYFGANVSPAALSELIEQAMAGHADPRLVAFCRAVSEAGYDPQLVIGDFSTRVATLDHLMAYIRENGRPQAIFCRDDILASRVHGALRRMGMRIPDDVSLVGCDGMEVTEDMDPPISTIIQPVEEMCVHAWRFLEARLTSAVPSRQYVRLEAQFVRRASSHMEAVPSRLARDGF